MKTDGCEQQLEAYGKSSGHEVNKSSLNKLAVKGLSKSSRNELTGKSVIPEIFISFISQFKYVISKNFKFDIYQGSLSSDV